MPEEEAKLNIPLTEEAKAEGQDPYLASDPDFETVKEGILDADPR